jgi:hypothetical protein
MIATELITKTFYVRQTPSTSLILDFGNDHIRGGLGAKDSNIALISNLLKNDHENKKSLASFH